MACRGDLQSDPYSPDINMPVTDYMVRDWSDAEMAAAAKKLQRRTFPESGAVLLQNIKAKTVCFRHDKEGDFFDSDGARFDKVYFVDYHHSSM